MLMKLDKGLLSRWRGKHYFLKQLDECLKALFLIYKTGKSLLNKDARSLAVEFPSVFMRLKDLCGSTVCEGQTKKLKIIIDFETNILEQLSQLGIMKSYTIAQTAGSFGIMVGCCLMFLPFSFPFPDKSFNCDTFLLIFFFLCVLQLTKQ